MGWLKLGARTAQKEVPVESVPEDLKYTTQHIESVSISPETSQSRTYPRAPLSLPDSELPFIPRDEVIKRKSAESGGVCK